MSKHSKPITKPMQTKQQQRAGTTPTTTTSTTTTGCSDGQAEENQSNRVQLEINGDYCN